jgi:hypothetical protein
MNLKKWWYIKFYAIVCCFISCKSEIDNETQKRILLSKSEVSIGDSIAVSLSDGSKISSLSIVPNVGTFRNGYYSAPSTLANQALSVELTANNAYSERCTIIRGSTTDSTISLWQTILPILTNNCNFSGCHGNGSRAGKVELSSYDSVIKFVVRYQPTQSILYLSLIKTDPLRRMPPAGPLNNNRIQLISNWIEQGALNN